MNAPHYSPTINWSAVALCVAILAGSGANLFAVSWWASDINTRTETIERAHAANVGLVGDVIDIKARLGAIERSLTRLEDYFFRRADKTDREPTPR